MATLGERSTSSVMLAPARPPRWYQSWRFWLMVAVAVPVLAYGWYVTEIDLGKLIQRLPRGWRLTSELFRPDWSIAWLVAQRMVQSVFLALMATLFAVPVAAPLSFLGARNLMRDSPARMAIYYVVRGFFNIFRSFEVLVVAIIFVTIVGIGPFAGMLGLFIHTVAVLGKLYSEQIENIDHGPVEAITATGASRLQTTLYAVVPQIVNPFISFTIYRWDVNVRMSIVVGFVGGGGVGQLLQQYTGLLEWNSVGTIALFTIAVVWAMDYASARIREKLS